MLLPTDPRCNLAVLWWGSADGVGRLITQRDRLRALVQAAVPEQASRCLRAAVSKASGNSRGSTYGRSSYRIGRSGTVHMHLLAGRPARVAAALRDAGPLFAKSCSHRTTGSNPSISPSDLVRIYAQQLRL